MAAETVRIALAIVAFVVMLDERNGALQAGLLHAEGAARFVIGFILFYQLIWGIHIGFEFMGTGSERGLGADGMDDGLAGRQGLIACPGEDTRGERNTVKLGAA